MSTRDYPPDVDDEEFDRDFVCTEPTCGAEGTKTVIVSHHEAWFDCETCGERTHVDPGDI